MARLSTVAKMALLCITLTLFTCNAIAQNSINFTINPQTSSAFDCYGGLNAQIVAEENDQLLISTRTTKSILTVRFPDDIAIRWVDKGLNVKQEYVMDDSRMMNLITTTLIDNSVVLLVGIISKDNYEVRRIVLDKTTLKKTYESAIFSTSKDRRIYASNWFATSDNGDFNALMVLTEGKNDQVDAQMIMLDDHLQILWQRESTLPGCNGMWVSNDGEVYMAAASEKKIYFAKLTDDDNYQYYTETSHELDRMVLLNVVDGCIVVGGTTHETVKINGTVITGYFGASYNMTTGRLAGTDYQTMSATEELVFQNLSSKAKTRGYTTHLNISNHVSTPYGGAMLLSYNVLEVVINNGVRNETYKRFGLLAMGVNKEGNITWRQPIRHYEKAASDQGFRQEMVVEGNKVHIFHVEDKKAPENMDMSRQLKKATNPFSRKGKLVAITIDANGQAEKTIVASNQKGLVVGYRHHWTNDHLYMLYTGKDKSGLFEIIK